MLRIVAFAAATLLALVSGHEYSSNSTACTRNYVVQAGDTCDKIGQRNYVSTYQVLAFNLPEAGPTCETLEIGHVSARVVTPPDDDSTSLLTIPIASLQELCLGRYGNDCQLVHRCGQSDTCDSIAAQYKIPLTLLQDNNPSMDCGQIYDGLVLCVAPGVMRPPPVPALDAAIQAQRNNNGSNSGNANRRRNAQGKEEDSPLAETTLVKERDVELEMDDEALARLAAARIGHAAGGGSRHTRGIHAPVVRHHA